nr:hypothetical protein Itr_chr13CG15350 [Ipomoea trifida]
MFRRMLQEEEEGMRSLAIPAVSPARESEVLLFRGRPRLLQISAVAVWLNPASAPLAGEENVLEKVRRRS